MSGSWVRARFTTSEKDWRPVTWPPPGPYWCTGYDSKGHATIVCYARTLGKVRSGWPELRNLDYESHQQITFTDRFPKPVWWDMIAAM